MKLHDFQKGDTINFRDNFGLRVNATILKAEQSGLLCDLGLEKNNGWTNLDFNEKYSLDGKHYFRFLQKNTKEFNSIQRGFYQN